MLRRKITPQDAGYVLIVCDSGEENNVDLEHEVVDDVYSVPNDDQLQNKRLGQVCHTYKIFTTYSALKCNPEWQITS